MNNTIVLILAGGKGTRLQSAVSDVPKPMAPIGDLPFLEYLVEYYKNLGLNNFAFLTGYKAQCIRDHFSHDKFSDLTIHYSHEESALGTGGAIKQAINNLPNFENYLVLNGDTFFSADPTVLFETNDFSIGLHYIEENDRYGSVEINKNYNILSFKEKMKTTSESFINSGIYKFSKDIVNHIGDGFVSIEQEVFPKLVEKNLIKGIPLAGQFIDIGIPQDFYSAQELIPKWSKEEKKPCLFLDRDGIIIEDTHYLHKVEDIKYIAEIFDFVKFFKNKGFYVVMVTNQAGVAKGKFSLEQMLDVNKSIEEEFNLNGISFDEIFYSPYHKEGSVPLYSRESLCRKPAPGMLLKAAKALPIDFKKSIMIGDKDSDIISLPYLKTYLIQGQYELKSPKDIIFNGLSELQESILKSDSKEL